MAFDEGLTERIPSALSARRDVAGKKMFSFESDADLSSWIETGVSFADALPPK